MKLACLVHVVFLQHTRDFAPCRFSDAGGLRAWIVSHAGVRKTCTNSGPCGPARVVPDLYQRLAVAPRNHSVNMINLISMAVRCKFPRMRPARQPALTEWAKCGNAGGPETRMRCIVSRSPGVGRRSVIHLTPGRFFLRYSSHYYQRWLARGTCNTLESL